MLSQYVTAIEKMAVNQRVGKVVEVIGTVIQATCPETFIGEICHIYTTKSDSYIVAEVVGLKFGKALLMPYEELSGVCFGAKVVATGHSTVISIGDGLLGRVVDAFGQPIDSKGKIAGVVSTSIEREDINPLSRERIDSVMSTCIKAIDNFTTLGRGQRVGLFAGSGVGKSSLLSAICANVFDEINVITLIGERGREVEDFVNNTLTEESIKNSIVIAATADQSPLVRVQAVYTACAIAEHFSRENKNVLFTMDSVTRFAMALREIGLAIGEPPTVKGYTTSVFSIIPKVIERCGSFKNRGAITAIFTVLVESEDFNDPIVDALRAVLDGHIVLTRELAEQGHYPAIDVLKSTSRLFNQLNESEHRKLVNKYRKIIADYLNSKDVIEFNKLSGKKEENELVSQYERISRFLVQDIGESLTLEESRQQLYLLDD